MKRKTFLRRLTGLIGVATSAKEMASLAAKNPAMVVGVDPYTTVANRSNIWTIIIQKGHFEKGDMITFDSHKYIYRVNDQDDKGLIATQVTNKNPHMIRFTYQEDAKRIASKLCSGPPSET